MPVHPRAQASSSFKRARLRSRLVTLAVFALQYRQNFRLRIASRDVNLSRTVNEYVHFATNAELRQVDSRLNGKARPRQHSPFLMRLQVVHVGAIAVRFLTDGMAGPMAKRFAIAGLFDHCPRGPVHLPALQRLAFVVGGTHTANRRIGA